LKVERKKTKDGKCKIKYKGREKYNYTEEIKKD
jgi:hypothetical protein